MTSGVPNPIAITSTPADLVGAEPVGNGLPVGPGLSVRLSSLTLREVRPKNPT